METVTAKQLADMKGVGTSTVNRWIQIKMFPNAYRVNTGATGAWLIPMSDVEAATYPKPGSARLRKMGAEAQKFIDKVTVLLKDAKAGQTITQTLTGMRMKKITAKGHVRTAAKMTNRTIRFIPSPPHEVTFAIVEENRHDEPNPKPTTGHHPSVNGATTVGLSDNGRGKISGEPLLVAPTVDDRAVSGNPQG